MKVFFVKYNDPIYVKLEKLDIMIRLASQANIAQVTNTTPPLSGGRGFPHVTRVAQTRTSDRLTVCCLSVQVLAELKEYATEVDVDFVRKAVRAIGRCAIKVEVGHVTSSCLFSKCFFLGLFFYFLSWLVCSRS